MKKLMFAALAVAGMSAFAADFKPVAVEKLTLSFKQPNEKKVDSIKLNGFVFWNDKGEQQAFVWNKKEQLDCVTNVTAFGKNVKLKKVAKLVKLGDYAVVNPYSVTTSKKQGKGISFGKDYVAYGSGTDLVTVETAKAGTAKESISGNIVNQATREYGTWKLAYDKSTVKNLGKGDFTIKDVLVKNKVEFWDL